jgi:hypothetical protein
MGDIEGSSWDRSQPNRSRRGLLQLQANLLPHTSGISDIVAVLGGREEPGKKYYIYKIWGCYISTHFRSICHNWCSSNNHGK